MLPFALASDVGYAFYADEESDENGGFESNNVLAGILKLNLAF